MKLTKEQQQFLKESHKEVSSEWKEKLEKNFPKLFPRVEFEVGKWYVSDMGSIVNLQCLRGNYGFNPEGIWFNEFEDGVFEKSRPATDEEVEEALIKEAKKRGFAMGVEYADSPYDGQSYVIGRNSFRSGWDYSSMYGLELEGLTIFKDGKWATIAKVTPELKAGKWYWLNNRVLVNFTRIADGNCWG